VAVERCDECRFDGGAWSDIEATDAIAGLPARWREAVAGLTPDQLHDRPIPDMWSISEYADHVREVLFGMRFLLDTAVTWPGTDLGEPPESRFDPEPRFIDIDAALSGIDREAAALRAGLTDLSASAWSAAVKVGGDDVDARWIVRHAVHDATHHLTDVDRLRRAG
jgi:hypothetical protein